MIAVMPPTDIREWHVVTANRDGAMTYVALAPESEWFPVPTETSALMTAPGGRVSIEQYLDLVHAQRDISVTTGNVDITLVEVLTDECTWVKRIRDDVVMGDRTEVVRTIAGNTLFASFTYSVERDLSITEERDWIARLKSASTAPESFDRLRRNVDAARRRALDRADHEYPHRADLRSARQRLIIADEQSTDWIVAALELALLTFNLSSLLEHEPVDPAEIVSIVGEGIRTLRRAAFKTLLDPDPQGFRALYEQILTTYVFDCTGTRPVSLRRADAGYQYLIDRAIETNTLTERLLFKKAVPLISRSVYDGEELLDRAMALLFPVMRGDVETSIEHFHLLMSVGAVWYKAAQRLAPSFHREALAFFDFAEAYASAASFSMSGSANYQERVILAMHEVQESQHAIQWNFQGASVVGDGPPVDTEHVGSLLFLRPLFSSRHFPLRNRFDGSSPHLLPYAAEPPQLSLEAALHRTLYRHFDAWRLGGPSDVLGMGSLKFAGGGKKTARETARDEWRTAFGSMLPTTAIALVLMWDSEGVLWETGALLSRHPEKCVLLMLPAAVAPDAGEAWEHARDKLADEGFPVPAYRPEGGYIFYGPDANVIRTLEFSALWSDTLWRELAAHAER